MLLPAAPLRRAAAARQGPDLLLDALAGLPQPPPTFLLGAERMESELRRRSARLHIEEHVHFAGWREDPGLWIADVSVCVVPSRYRREDTHIPLHRRCSNGSR